MRKIKISLFVVMVLLMTCMSSVLASDSPDLNDSAYALVHDISEGSISFTDDGYRIGSSGAYTAYTGTVKITGTASSSSTAITVSAGKHSIELDNVNMENTGYNGSVIVVSNEATLNLSLVGENTLTGHCATQSGSGAAIQVQSAATLNISGTGTLTASGAVAIGNKSTAGNISITNATIIASINSNYTINAAIGGGSGVGDISIIDANVTVSASQYTYAAAIGTGSGSAGTITIGGTSVVNASSGADTCVIGAGSFDEIIIKDNAIVQANGFGKGAVIGLANTSSGTGTITISGNAQVTTTQTLWGSIYNGAALGASIHEDTAYVVPEGVSVNILDNAIVKMYDSPLSFKSESIVIADTATVQSLNKHDFDNNDPIYDTLEDADGDTLRFIKIDDTSLNGIGFTGELSLTDGTNTYIIDCTALSGTYTPYYYMTFIVVAGEYKLYNSDGEVAQLDGEDIIFDASDTDVRTDINGYSFVSTEVEGDVNSDDVVDIFDVQYILQIAT